MVSLARSGDSPESVGALAQMLEIEPELRHLVLTCNRQGKLANSFRNDPGSRSSPWTTAPTTAVCHTSSFTISRWEPAF